VLFSKHDKRLAEVWLSIWAGLCFVSTLATALSFLVDGARCRYPERPALFLALCLNLASVGWGVRAAAGRTAVACHSLPHPTAAGFLSVSVLLSHDGLANANCAVVFLLLYYFGMAALVW
jgi:Frizzled/Smoothened family membrane region